MLRAIGLLPLVLFLGQAPSPQPVERPQGANQRIKVHGGSLERNLSGDIRLAIDVGDRDRTITATSKELHAVLDTYEVTHQFEVYDGDHVSGVARQLATKVFPFFSASLTFK